MTTSRYPDTSTRPTKTLPTLTWRCRHDLLRSPIFHFDPLTVLSPLCSYLLPRPPAALAPSSTRPPAAPCLSMSWVLPTRSTTAFFVPPLTCCYRHNLLQSPAVYFDLPHLPIILAWPLAPFRHLAIPPRCLQYLVSLVSTLILRPSFTLPLPIHSSSTLLDIV
ncbi:hypothetical protein EDB19DRAFT_455474 [Suillus lakei]|nr:hypothetical protein EDB19DRAFT_455474 [Suillus lakei]